MKCSIRLESLSLRRCPTFRNRPEVAQQGPRLDPESESLAEALAHCDVEEIEVEWSIGCRLKLGMSSRSSWIDRSSGGYCQRRVDVAAPVQAV